MFTLTHLIPIQYLFILFSVRKNQASIIFKTFAYLINFLYMTNCKWIEWWSPKLYVHILTPGTCECDLT